MAIAIALLCGREIKYGHISNGIVTVCTATWLYKHNRGRPGWTMHLRIGVANDYKYVCDAFDAGRCAVVVSMSETTAARPVSFVVCPWMVWCRVSRWLVWSPCSRRPFISFTGVQQYFIILRWRPLVFQPALARSIEPAVIPELLEIFISTCLSCLREGGGSASGGPILLSAKKIIDSLTRPWNYCF